MKLTRSQLKRIIRDGVGLARKIDVAVDVEELHARVTALEAQIKALHAQIATIPRR